jgi:hypothetical protein
MLIASTPVAASTRHSKVLCGWPADDREWFLRAGETDVGPHPLNLEMFSPASTRKGACKSRDLR